MIETQIEINAPPSKVREVFLENSKYPEWVTAPVKKFESADSAKSLSSLQPGDKVNCDMYGAQFTAEITENSSTLFQWQGPPVFGLVAGRHSFHYEAIEGGEKTLFKQTEIFSGILGWAMSPSLLGGKILGGFKQFNEDLKGRVEGLKGA